MPHTPAGISRHRAAYLAGDGPLAYFISFRCYGTWLHGDERGSTDRHHNIVGTPFLVPDETRLEREAARLTHPPVEIGPQWRAVVDGTVREVCRYRGWGLHAVSVRSNHVHVVVTSPLPPEPVMNDLKAYSTRRLVEAGLLTRGIRPWSRHGSTRYLWTEAEVNTACRYVLEGQDGPLPGSEPGTAPDGA